MYWKRERWAWEVGAREVRSGCEEGVCSFEGWDRGGKGGVAGMSWGAWCVRQGAPHSQLSWRCCEVQPSGGKSESGVSCVGRGEIVWIERGWWVKAIFDMRGGAPIDRLMPARSMAVVFGFFGFVVLVYWLCSLGVGRFCFEEGS